MPLALRETSQKVAFVAQKSTLCIIFSAEKILKEWGIVKVKGPVRAPARVRAKVVGKTTMSPRT